MSTGQGVLRLLCVGPASWAFLTLLPLAMPCVKSLPVYKSNAATQRKRAKRRIAESFANVGMTNVNQLTRGFAALRQIFAALRFTRDGDSNVHECVMVGLMVPSRSPKPNSQGFSDYTLATTLGHLTAGWWDAQGWPARGSGRPASSRPPRPAPRPGPAARARGVMSRRDVRSARSTRFA